MRLDINFASREHVLVRKVYLLLVLGIAGCVAATAVGYYMYLNDVRTSDRLRADIASHQKKLDETRKIVGGYAASLGPGTVKQAYNEAAFANAAISRRAFSWTTFLNRLEELVPDGVGITSIKPDFSSLYVDLSGSATDMNRVTEFIGRLARSEYFGDIPPTFSATEGEVDKVAKKTLWTFSLKIQYIPEPDAAPAVPGKEGL